MVVKTRKEQAAAATARAAAQRWAAPAVTSSRTRSSTRTWPDSIPTPPQKTPPVPCAPRSSPGTAGPWSNRLGTPPPIGSTALRLVAPTRNEIVRLLHELSETEHGLEHVFDWSVFRRIRRARSQHCHYYRQIALEPWQNGNATVVPENPPRQGPDAVPGPPPPVRTDHPMCR